MSSGLLSLLIISSGFLNQFKNPEEMIRFCSPYLVPMFILKLPISSIIKVLYCKLMEKGGAVRVVCKE